MSLRLNRLLNNLALFVISGQHSCYDMFLVVVACLIINNPFKRLILSQFLRYVMVRMQLIVRLEYKKECSGFMSVSRVRQFQFQLKCPTR